MTPDMRAILDEWLRSGDPDKVRHAEWRLSLPDDYTPPPETDAERAARLIMENPEVPGDVRRGCCP